MWKTCLVRINENKQKLDIQKWIPNIKLIIILIIVVFAKILVSYEKKPEWKVNPLPFKILTFLVTLLLRFLKDFLNPPPFSKFLKTLSSLLGGGSGLMISGWLSDDFGEKRSWLISLILEAKFENDPNNVNFNIYLILYIIWYFFDFSYKGPNHLKLSHCILD